MPGPEATIERQIVDEAEADGWIVFKLAFLGVKGAPDRIFGKSGRCVVIEFKRPASGKRKAGEESKSQRNRRKELAVSFGWELHVCNTLKDAREILHLVE